MSIVKIGIVGDRSLMPSAIDSLKKNESVEVVGTFDSTDELNYKDFYGVFPLTSLLRKCDALYIVGNSQLFLYDTIVESAKYGVHILLDKFPDFTIHQIKNLKKILKESNSVFFIANTQGTSALYTSARQYLNKVSHINLNLEIPFNTTELKRRTIINESVDMLIRSNSSPVSKIKANKHYVFSHIPEKLKLSIQFDNGCVADVTINSLCQEMKNELTFFQKGKILTLDLLSHQLFETKLESNKENLLIEAQMDSKSPNSNKIIQIIEKKVMYFDAMQKDLFNFVECIHFQISPLVGIDELEEVAKVVHHLQFTEHEPIV